MSKRIRRPHMKMKKHPFETKHVIVAGCAAIAMVMGAMSAGASFSTPNDRTATKAEVSSIVDATSTDGKQPSAVSGTGMSRQHTLEVRNFLQQQGTPLYVTPVPSKALRNKLSPIFGTTDPVRFMDQMVQMQQQQQAQATDSNTKSGTISKDGTQPSPTDGTNTGDSSTITPTDDTTDTDGSESKPADSSTPTDSGGAASQSMLMNDSTPAQ